MSDKTNITPDMAKILLMWSIGAGNSAKRFNGENPIPKKTKVATPKNRYLEPMPRQHTTIQMDVTIPSAAMDIIRYGHIAEEMEDHWFMYCNKSTIRYYRSWTGICIYIAKSLVSHFNGTLM